MQTVTPIIASTGPSSAAPSTDSADKDAFPSTLRGAMAPRDGKSSPPTAGKSVPETTEAPSAEAAPDAETAAAEPTAPAAEPVTPPAGKQPATADAKAPPATTVSPEVPKIANALQDIAASRKVAQSGSTPDAATRCECASDTPGKSGKAEKLRGKADKLLTDDTPAAHTGQDAQIATDAPSTIPASPTAPVTAPALPPATPSSNDNPVAAAATQHAREVVLERPAASRAFGLLDKAPSTDSATPDKDAPATDAVPAASPASVAAPDADAPKQLTAALAGSAPFAASTAQTQSAPDFAALGASALVAAGGQAAPAPALSGGTAAPSSAPPDFNIAAPPGSPQFGPEISERVLWLVRDGLQEARLQLNPRDLGPVEVRLAIGDGAAQVSFSTQHAGTAAAVQQSLPQLRDMLAQQGLQLGQATVSHQPAGDGQAAQQQAQGSGGQPGWERGRGADLDDSLPLPTARVVGHGLVDAYA